MVTNCNSKKNYKIILTYYDFKDIYENFKISVIDYDILQLKKKLYGCI